MKIWWLLAAVLTMMVAVPSVDAAEDTYTVKRGDTLWKISVRYEIGLSEIINANPQFENPDLIYPGDEVTVPLKTETKSIEQLAVEKTNEQRRANGLAPLEIDWQLARVARYKSQDMRDKGYFSHQSPTYGSPFEMMRQFNISYRKAAENIAAGQSTAERVVNGWMNSPGHRKNILDPDFTTIGIGYVEGGSYGHYWTQMFITK